MNKRKKKEAYRFLEEMGLSRKERSSFMKELYEIRDQYGTGGMDLEEHAEYLIIRREACHGCGSAGNPGLEWDDCPNCPDR